MAIQDRVKKLIRPEILTLNTYGVVDPGDLIKLDAMENPWPWPEEIKHAWLQRLEKVSFNRYPDARAMGLRLRLGETMGVPVGMELLLGNGSDEIIQMILLALAKPRAVVMAPTPSFVMYALTAQFVGMEFVPVPLRPKDFMLDIEMMCAAIRKYQPAVIFLAYPNNPTGNLFESDEIETIIQATEGLVVVDEAYHAFAGKSFMPRLPDYKNLLVMRTLSKLGLAGLRLGMLAGDPAWLQEFDKVRLPYNINSLTQASAEFALEHFDFFQQQAARICEERTRLAANMAGLSNIEIWPSAANFILFRVRGKTADDIFQGLRERGVLIKKFDGVDTLLEGCLRVTVGTPQENDVFIKALNGLV